MIDLKIRQLRQFLSLNQTDFAARLGVTQSLLSAYENRRRNVPPSFVKSLIDKFNLDKSWLYDNKVNSDPLFRNEDVYKPQVINIFDLCTESPAEILQSALKIYITQMDNTNLAYKKDVLNKVLRTIDSYMNVLKS